MEHWHIWVIAGVVLMIAEIFTPGFVLACFGVACLIAAVFAACDVGLTAEVIVFCVASIVAFFTVRPLFSKRFYRSDAAARTNVDALTGKVGMVAERIDPSMNIGRVVLGGDNWRAASVDGAVIERGDQVEVIRVEGTRLFVRQTSRKKEE
ncbi:MAG: NfeD family protein [Candidatus Coatesbacteria bacterium]|nr:NfeD family protein [Candidatus Coatesbacteria bacterium]